MFRRKFCVSMVKDKRLTLARMCFGKDIFDGSRGDPYPVLEREGEFTERIEGGTYRLAGGEGARVVRMIGGHFPYATAEAEIETMGLGCAIVYAAPQGRFGVRFFLRGGRVWCAGEAKMRAEGSLHATGPDLKDDAEYLLPGEEKDCGIDFRPGLKMLVTARREYFDVYADAGNGAGYICSFRVPGFEDMDMEDVFRRTQTALEVFGGAEIRGVWMGMDSGIAQADIRPIRYENGEVMVEGGKVYLTMSVRMQAQQYQGVFSWIPGTCEFELTGALFYAAGDGRWGNDVAASVVYHSEKKMWYIWVCSFCRGHVLGHGTARGDVRFGVNAIDIELMERMPEGGRDEMFLGKRGDEDPDFVYDERRGKWLMTICRLIGWEQGRPYRYFLFESDEPFGGYRFVSRAESGSETGGSIVPDGDGWAFVCGSSFDKRAEYHAYTLPDLSKWAPLHCDFDDGGFRGWGTVMPIWCGSRKRVFWLTFDRQLGSKYNWSYGNLYCFEADGR